MQDGVIDTSTMNIPPGRYTGMTMAQYHGNTAGISRSDLMAFKRSPAHFKHRRIHRDDATPSTSLGEALHMRVLEPSRFAEEYVRAPKVDRRTTDGKRLWGEFTEMNRGKKFLDAVETQAIEGMAVMLEKHPIAGPLLQGGEREVSYFWVDPETGLLLKARPDLITPDRIVVDLKTSNDASEFRFTRQATNYGYHIQATMVWEAMERIDGAPPKAYIMVVVESDEPYAVACYALDSLEVRKCRIRLRDILLGFDYWQRQGDERWDGYPLEIIPLRLPDWF